MEVEVEVEVEEVVEVEVEMEVEVEVRTCGNTRMSVHARTRDAINYNGPVPVHWSLRLD